MTYEAPSVRKAFLILDQISKRPQGLGISDAARDLNMSKGTVHGIFAALSDLGAITRNPVTKKYTLGLTLFELGRLAYAQIDLVALARPVMEELMEQSSQSVFVGILNGRRVTILDMVESRQDLKITSPRGTTIPLVAGAAGKAILTLMDDAQADAMIREKPLPRFTDHSITDPERYLEAVKQARAQGYATDDEEYISGVRAVAAPIPDGLQLKSALWVVGFKTTLDDTKMHALIRATRDAARRITDDIDRARHGDSR